MGRDSVLLTHSQSGDDYVRNLKPSIFVVFSLLASAFMHGEEGRQFPLKGVVASEPLYGLMLRDAPPEVSGFRYKLGKEQCGIGNGGEFVATEELLVANGEVWFKVAVNTQGTMLANSCPVVTLPRTGWMVAKVKNKWVVTITDQALALPSGAGTATDKPQPAPPGARVIGPENQQHFAPLKDALLLVLGTVLAVCMVAIRRKQDIAPRVWLTRLVMFELAVVVLINITIAFAFADLYVGNSSAVFHTLDALKKAHGGLAVFGFVLSLFVLRFMSFAD
jgi:hypothetical protein